MNSPSPAAPPPGGQHPAVPHAEARLALGALVLGALDAADRAAVEAHVADCTECAAELAGFAALPDLLGRLTPEQAAAIGPGLPNPLEPPSELLERVLASGRAEQPRTTRSPTRPRRIAVWAAGALAAAAGLAWLIAGPLTGSGELPGDAPEVVVVEASDVVTAVRAELTLSATPNGTELALALAGVRPGEDCQLVAWTADGRKEVASSWRASYRGDADVTGSTSLTLAEIAGVTVRTPDGRKLLVLNVPS